MEAGKRVCVFGEPDREGGAPAVGVQGTAGARQKDALEIPLPGFGGVIVASFKAVDFDVARALQIQMSRSKSKQRELEYACDILIRHCKGIYAKNPETDELVDLRPDAPVQPKFDVYLVELIPELRMDGETDEQLTARNILRRAFIKDMAVMSAFRILQDWSDGLGEEAVEVLRGE